jgi:hypothetical protein
LFYLSAVLAIWLGMYFPGLDILLCIVYIYLLWEEGKYAAQKVQNRKKQALTAFLWQLPGIVLSASVIAGLDRLTDFAYYFLFMLELWQTPILPLISLIPAWTIFEHPLYFYLLFIMVPAVTIFYYLPARKYVRNS